MKLRMLQATALVTTVLLVGALPTAAEAVPVSVPVQTKKASGKKISAETLLKRLTVREESRKTYKRAKFGDWIDADRDGCYTRAEVLKEESKRKTKKRNRCTITTGRWKSLYDGKTFRHAKYVEIDHLVPLAEAWRSGAHKWSKKKRKAFANDLGFEWSLIAVSSATNRSKSDSGPEDWLPKQRACTYVSAWVAVKSRWKLSIDPYEKDGIEHVLRNCSADQKRVTKPGKPNIGKLAGKTRKKKQSSSWSYKNCAEAGRVVYRGEPGYGSHLDRDNDGIGCEAYA